MLKCPLQVKHLVLCIAHPIAKGQSHCAETTRHARQRAPAAHRRCAAGPNGFDGIFNAGKPGGSAPAFLTCLFCWQIGLFRPKYQHSDRSPPSQTALRIAPRPPPSQSRQGRTDTRSYLLCSVSGRYSGRARSRISHISRPGLTARSRLPRNSSPAPWGTRMSAASCVLTARSHWMRCISPERSSCCFPRAGNAGSRGREHRRRHYRWGPVFPQSRGRRGQPDDPHHPSGRTRLSRAARTDRADDHTPERRRTCPPQLVATGNHPLSAQRFYPEFASRSGRGRTALAGGAAGVWTRRNGRGAYIRPVSRSHPDPARGQLIYRDAIHLQGDLAAQLSRPGVLASCRPAAVRWRPSCWPHQKQRPRWDGCALTCRTVATPSAAPRSLPPIYCTCGSWRWIVLSCARACCPFLTG